MRAVTFDQLGVVDGRPVLQERAEALGFTVLDPRRTRDWPIAPLTVDATGTPAGLRTVLKHTAPDGICSCVWSLHRRGVIPLAAEYFRNVTLHIGRAHIRALVADVLDLIASGRFQPEVVTTNVASFDDTPAALQDHCHGNAMKTILLAD